MISLFTKFHSEIEIKGPIKEPTGCFWKIKKDNITVGYLLGSIHITPNHSLNLNRHINKYFKKSDRLAVAIDVTKKSYSFKAKQRWEKKCNSLTSDQIDNICTVLKNFFPDESDKVDFNDHQKKIHFILEAITKLISKIGIFPGIDLQLIQKAKRYNKPIEDLETEKQYRQQKSI